MWRCTTFLVEKTQFSVNKNQKCANKFKILTFSFPKIFKCEFIFLAHLLRSRA